MPAVVKLSELGPVEQKDFEETVRSFANEVRAHAAHVKAVEEGVAQPYPAPSAAELISRCVRTKGNGEVIVDFTIEDDRPKPPSETEKAAMAFRSRKAQLINQVTAEENRLVAEVFPDAKKRAINYRRGDIEKADNERRQKAHVERQNEIQTAALAMHAKVAEANEASRAAMEKLQKDLLSKGFVERMKDAIVGTPLIDVTPHTEAVMEAIKAIPPALSAEEIERAAADGRSQEDAEFLDQFEKIKTRIEALARHGAKLHAQIHDLTIENVDTWKPEAFPS